MKNSVVVVHFFSFRWETPFLGKFGPKHQNCQFKLKFGTQTNLNMKNSMLVFTLSALDQKQNCQFKLKFSTQINSNMQNSMEVFTFSVLYWKYTFEGKFGIKIQYCQFKLKFGTQTNSNMQNSMLCSLFVFQTGSTLFGKRK